MPLLVGKEKKMVKDPIHLTWLGAAGFHLKYVGKELLLDPFLSRPDGASPIPRTDVDNFRQISLILVTHGHFDHAMDVGELAKKTGAMVCAPEIICSHLRELGIKSDRLYPCERHTRLEWNGTSIRVIPSRHMRFDLKITAINLFRILKGGFPFKLLRLWRDYPMGSTSEFLMDFGDYRVLFSGSGGSNWKKIATLQPNCIMVPFADRSDLPKFYMGAVATLRPETLVLHHFDMLFPYLFNEYPIQQFRERLLSEFPQVRLIVPKPGISFTVP